MDVTHRGVDAGVVFIGSKELQVLLLRNLDVDAKAVGVETGLADESLGSPGNRLHMDITVVTVGGAEVADDANHSLHCVIGILDDAGREKKTLDIITAVELQSQLDKFGRSESGARNVVGTAVDTISAIVDAMVGEHYLQKRDATTVGSETMANPPTGSATDMAILTSTRSTGRCARDIVFGALSQHFKFTEDGVVHSSAASYKKFWHASWKVEGQSEQCFNNN